VKFYTFQFISVQICPFLFFAVQIMRSFQFISFLIHFSSVQIFPVHSSYWFSIHISSFQFIYGGVKKSFVAMG